MKKKQRKERETDFFKQEEIDLDELEKVTGAGLRDVYKTSTKDIDQSITDRI